MSFRPSVCPSVGPGSGVGVEVGGRVSFNWRWERLCLSACLFIGGQRSRGGEGVTVQRLRMSVCLSVLEGIGLSA